MLQEHQLQVSVLGDCGGLHPLCDDCEVSCVGDGLLAVAALPLHVAGAIIIADTALLVLHRWPNPG